MVPKNPYLNRSRISKGKFQDIVKYFALDIEATKIAELTGLNRNTVNKYLFLIRKRITEECENEFPVFDKNVVEKIYFKPPWGKTKRGNGKFIILGILKSDRKIFMKIIPNSSKTRIQAGIQGKLGFENAIQAKKLEGHSGMADLDLLNNFRVYPSDEGQFGKKNKRINEIKNFWGIAKMRLSKFRGLSKSTFIFHLKECEFRFNHRSDDLYKIILDVIKKRPLN